jgi:hypothetical protein
MSLAFLELFDGTWRRFGEITYYLGLTRDLGNCFSYVVFESGNAKSLIDITSNRR